MNYSDIQEIPTRLLLEHPENSNYMDTQTSQKLKTHIEKTGRYEPLIVRPHPTENGKYQVINGHNRLRILRALRYQTAHCIIWHIDDDQTRLYLATLNRLSGSDTPERRAILIENLLGSFSKDELLSLLPEDEKQLEKLKQLIQIKPNEMIKKDIPQKDIKVPVIVTFMLEEQEAKELDFVLDMIIDNFNNNLSRSKALTNLTHFYLEQFNPILFIEE
jgi:hypothetical protein